MNPDSSSIWVSPLSEEILKIEEEQAHLHRTSWINKMDKIKNRLISHKKNGVALNEFPILLASIRAVQISSNFLKSELLLKNMNPPKGSNL